MIAYIKGLIVHREPGFVIIDINGVGYQIFISLNTFHALQKVEQTTLHTYFHVKEDAQILYGFQEVSEKALFLDLISISGVGPSTGLNMMSSMGVNEMKGAIIQEDHRKIQSIKGIGAKTAQRIVLELKDKFRKEGIQGPSSDNHSGNNNTIQKEAFSALVTLGINKNLAEKAIREIWKDSEGEITLEELIKLALNKV